MMTHPKRWIPKPAQGDSAEGKWRRVRRDGPFEVEVAEGEGGGKFKGNVYTDASGRWPKEENLRRVGWAAVEIDAEGKIAAVCSGPLDYPLQTVVAGELRASVEGLERAGPGYHRQVFDCAVIGQGARKGRAWCTASTRPMADLWRRWWNAKEKAPEAEMAKCKAHTTASQIGVEISLEDREGNEKADQEAKIAVDRHPRDEKAEERYFRSEKLVRRYGMMIGFLGSCSEERDCEGRADRGRTVRRASLALHIRQHKAGWDKQSEAWRCERCGIGYKGQPTKKDEEGKWRWGKCDRQLGFRRLFVDPDEEGDGHMLVACGIWLWCTSCGGVR